MKSHSDQPSKPIAISPERHRQILALLDGTLPEEDFANLEGALRHDKALRSAYLHAADMEAELEDRLGAAGSTGNSDKLEDNRVIRFRNPVPAWAGIAAALVLGSVLTFLLLGPWREPRTVASRSTYLSVALPGQDEVAVVTEIESVTWGQNEGEETVAPIGIGSRLKPGTLRLASGAVQLDFLSGATLRLEGPAELQLLSAELAYLSSGRAAAHVPEEAVGFTVKTPDSAVVDLGTEFALNVSDTGDSLVHVYDGEVHVSLLGQDGATLSSSPLTTGASLDVHPRTLSLLERPGDTGVSELPAVRPLDASLLSVPETYRQAVLDAKPAFYWPFEDAPDGESYADLSPQALPAVVTGAVRPVSGNANHAAEFRGTPDNPTFLTPARNEFQANAGNYTIELWAKPMKLHWATLFNLIANRPLSDSAPDTHSGDPNHLTVVELMHRSHFIHRPNAVRFLHRWPPNKGGGVNAFSGEQFTPGRWMHIVAVKDEEEIRLYLNGHLAKVAEKTADTDNLAYRVVLGQLDDLRAVRQFQGYLDECAFYEHALSEEEIAAHYALLAKANPDQLVSP